jgi:ABC-type sugar transport system ATPase subunit
VSAGKLIRDVSFSLHAGEILGLAGLVGAGRSEIVRAIFGLDPIASGDITVRGKKAHISRPDEAMALGIGLVPEDRKKEGLFLVKEVRFNLTLKVLRRFINPLRVSKAKEAAIVERYIKELSIKTPSPEQLIGNLSGGNQQKVIIARWLATEPSVLILDEPTRGVDVGAKAEIYAIMNELAAKGVAIIMISSELPEIINMSDRVVVMGDGHVKGILPREALSQEKIMFLATEGM